MRYNQLGMNCSNVGNGASILCLKFQWWHIFSDSFNSNITSKLDFHCQNIAQWKLKSTSSKYIHEQIHVQLHHWKILLNTRIRAALPNFSSFRSVYFFRINKMFPCSWLRFVNDEHWTSPFIVVTPVAQHRSLRCFTYIAEAKVTWNVVKRKNCTHTVQNAKGVHLCDCMA